jgi:hypothetical protein
MLYQDQQKDGSISGIQTIQFEYSREGEVRGIERCKKKIKDGTIFIKHRDENKHRLCGPSM